MGHFTVAMSARGFEAHGLDFAERIIEALNERYPDIFVEGDARWSPYPGGYFDATYSPGVCEHFEEGPDAVLAEAFRDLRPSGALYVSIPYLNALRRHRWKGDKGEREFCQYLVTRNGMITTLYDRASRLRM